MKDRKERVRHRVGVGMGAMHTCRGRRAGAAGCAGWRSGGKSAVSARGRKPLRPSAVLPCHLPKHAPSTATTSHQCITIDRTLKSAPHPGMRCVRGASTTCILMSRPALRQKGAMAAPSGPVVSIYGAAKV